MAIQDKTKFYRDETAPDRRNRRGGLRPARWRKEPAASCFRRSGLPLPAMIAAAALIALSLPAAFCQPGVSPYYKTPDSLAGKTVIIPAGTTFEGRIDITIGSSISRQGTSFIISLSSPVLANGTDVLIPAGAEVLGEVVQAVAASNVPHKKKEKPPGQLRVQITALRMPDGMTFPMVANLVGEEDVPNMYGGAGGYGRSKVHLGSSVGYVGTQQGFQAAQPGRNGNGYRSNNASPVVTKNELLSDPIMGRDSDMDGEAKMAIRSLVKKKRDLYIYAGSPLTVRLEAPFRMGIGSSSAQESALDSKPFGAESSPSNYSNPSAAKHPEGRYAPTPAAPSSTYPPPSGYPPSSNYTPSAGYPPSGFAPPPPGATLTPAPYNNSQSGQGNTNRTRTQDSNF